MLSVNQLTFKVKNKTLIDRAYAKRYAGQLLCASWQKRVR